MLDPDQKLDLYDLVTAKGHRGVVLEIFEANPMAYIVELFNESGETVEIATVRHSEIERVD